VQCSVAEVRQDHLAGLSPHQPRGWQRVTLLVMLVAASERWSLLLEREAQGALQLQDLSVLLLLVRPQGQVHWAPQGHQSLARLGCL
jgi:hypothetical protein